MCLLVLERSLVYFHSTTESKMWDVAEKEWSIILLVSFLCCFPHCWHWYFSGTTMGWFKNLNRKQIETYHPSPALPHPPLFFFLDSFCKLGHNGSDSVCWVLCKSRERTEQQEPPNSSRNSPRIGVSLPEKNSSM